MTQILIVAADAIMCRKLTASVQHLHRPVIALTRRDEAIPLIDAVERQVMVYAPGYGGDIGWLAETLEAHPGLRLVYLSPIPWASLSYERARCLLAPPNPNALNVALLRQMVSEMLAVGSGTAL